MNINVIHGIAGIALNNFNVLDFEPSVLPRENESEVSEQSSTYCQKFDRKPRNHGHVETLNFEKCQKHQREEYIGQCLKFSDNRQRVDKIEQSTINFIQLHR